MALYVIGDVQGCYDALQQLLQRIAYDSQRDHLWFTGDLVNRGPKSLECLRFIKSLPNCVSVLGNHDLHLLAVAYVGAKPANLDTLDSILAAPDRDELLDWLRHRPLLHHDETRRLTLIHAGLPPHWSLEDAQRHAHEVERVLRSERINDYLTHMYGNQPDRWSEELTGWDKLRFSTNCFTRLRYIDQRGRLQLKEKGPLSKKPAGLQPWFAVPERQSAQHHIVFGHWSTLDLHQTHNILAIDTGCLWGGALTAARFDDNGNLEVITQQQCEMVYTPKL